MSQLLQTAQSWMASDTVIGEHPDRQVLVVGDTIVGHTLTLLLHQAGFDPLLVTASDRANESEIAYLWPATVQTLEFVDVGLSTLEYTTAVNNVSVRNGIECHSHQVGGEPPLVVPTDELHGLLKQRTAEQSRSTDRKVETVCSRDDGAVVEFADGIREWFDLVLYAESTETAGQTPNDESVGTNSLTQYEIVLGGETLVFEEPQYIDLWRPEAHVQSIPRQTSECLVRITAPQETMIDSITERIAGPLPVEATASLDTKLTETAPSTVRQTALEDRHMDTSWWDSGRIGYCGQAVCECVPASGFGLSFGIEDALAFVTELTRNEGSVTDVITAYAEQRLQRFRTLLRAASLAPPDHVALSSVPSDSLLETVGLLRSVSLAPLFGGKLLSVQQTDVGYR